MAWIKVPAEHHPIFRAALPKDPRVDTFPMFGGVAAKVNGNFFAGLFGRSSILWLPENERGEALALEGAAYFDPMGDGRARSDKVMLPEAMMEEPDELRRWLARAFKAAVKLPLKVKEAKKKSAKKPEKAKAKAEKPKAEAKQPKAKKPKAKKPETAKPKAK